MKKHGANLVTLIRAIGIIILLFGLPAVTLRGQQWVILFYTIFALTDSLDGWLARSRFGRVTPLGKILDPFADKLLILVYLPLIETHQIRWYFVAILIIRDIYVSTLRIIASMHHEVMAAKLTGKLKTIISLPLAGVLLGRAHDVNLDVSLQLPILGPLSAGMIHFALSIPESWIIGVIWFLMAITVLSVIEYSSFLFDRQRLYALVE